MVLALGAVNLNLLLEIIQFNVVFLFQLLGHFFVILFKFTDLLLVVLHPLLKLDVQGGDRHSHLLSYILIPADFLGERF